MTTLVNNKDFIAANKVKQKWIRGTKIQRSMP